MSYKELRDATMSKQTLKDQIAELEAELAQLVTDTHTKPLNNKVSFLRSHKGKNPISKIGSSATRSKKDRRSGDDRREVGDLAYFKRGGKERRSYDERRKVLDQSDQSILLKW